MYVCVCVCIYESGDFACAELVSAMCGSNWIDVCSGQLMFLPALIRCKIRE
jgi:hypothetical protein